MNLYRLENWRMPWGDYGDLLLSGLTNEDKDRSRIISRTGPFVPPIIISGIWDLIITDKVKEMLAESTLSGFEIQEVKKGKIVEIHRENWSFESEEPVFYPESGEPEDYIFEGEHSNSVSDAVGQLWVMKLEKSGIYDDHRFISSTEFDFFMPENKGMIFVSERAKHWMEVNFVTEWIVFQDIDVG